MKKISLALLAVVMLFTFAACSSEAKQPDLSALKDTLRSGLDLPEMAEITKENMETQLSIPGDSFEEVYCYVAGSGMATDEILVGKLTAEAKKDDVIKAIEARRDMQYDLFSQYDAAQAEKAKNSVIHSVKAGSTEYVLFAVCNDSAKAKKIFTDAF